MSPFPVSHNPSPTLPPNKVGVVEVTSSRLGKLASFYIINYPIGPRNSVPKHAPVAWPITSDRWDNRSGDLIAWRTRHHSHNTAPPGNESCKLGLDGRLLAPDGPLGCRFFWASRPASDFGVAVQGLPEPSAGYEVGPAKCLPRSRIRSRPPSTPRCPHITWRLSRQRSCSSNLTSSDGKRPMLHPWLDNTAKKFRPLLQQAAIPNSNST